MASRNTRLLPTLQVSQKVWLDNRNLPLRYKSGKMTQRREGPFPITRKLGPITYELKLPDSWKIHNKFHVQLLTPLEENETYGEIFSAPPPDLVDGEEEWEIEGIMNHKETGKGRLYQIRWKGYPPTEDSWETEEALEHSQDILNEYKKSNKLDNQKDVPTKHSKARCRKPRNHP